MKLFPARRLPLTAACALLLAGCATPEPVAYVGLASSNQLIPNGGDESGRVPFRYSTGADWRRYAKAFIEPVEIYRGADGQFGSLTEEDKLALARHMQGAFAQRLGRRFAIAQGPGPDTLVVKLTLTGAAANTAVLSTLSRFDIAGGLYNGVQAARGREGMMTGAVLYAVELRDGATDRLLEAFVTKQYPGAYNIPAGIGALAAARTGIDKGAEALARQLE